jgi:hypothetical protein
MIGEVSLYGIYLPPLLLLIVPTLLASRLVSALLARAGLYRWVWHPALFDAAVFVILLGAFSFFTRNWF